jgi:alkylation response protein AidB-like acyl-CoA dehydrogenase
VDLDLTSEHQDMAAIVRSIAQAAPPGAAGDDAVNDALGDAEIRGMLLPDADGGLGLNVTEAAVVLEQLGARPTARAWVADLVAAPLALTALTGTTGAEHAVRPRERLLSGDGGPGVARQRANGTIDGLPAPPGAEEFLVLGVGRVGLAPAAGAVPSVRRDLAGRRGHVCLAPDTVTWYDVGESAARCLGHARLGAAAFVLGAGEAALALAVEYARARRQFGREIGSFQAVKHRLADARIALTFARPVLLAASWAAVTDTRPAGRDAAAALLRCGDAAEFSARTALQVHGAIGYTEECAVGALLTQVREAREQWGPTRRLRDGLAAALEHSAVPIGGDDV